MTDKFETYMETVEARIEKNEGLPMCRTLPVKAEVLPKIKRARGRGKGKKRGVEFQAIVSIKLDKVRSLYQVRRAVKAYFPDNDFMDPDGEVPLGWVKVEVKEL